MRPLFDLLHFYISPGHNYFGHHGQKAGTNPMLEVDELHCVAGRGIESDRFFDFREDYRGQITFFAHEVYEDLCHRFDVWNKAPSVFRRNVITRGANLNLLIGEEFSIQGIRFVGVEHCKPCYWMDEAFAPGAEKLLQDRGGLRARIISSGTLRLSSVAAAC